MPSIVDTRQPLDLAVVAALSLGALLAVGMHAPAVLLVPLGLALLLFLPGYALAACLHPQEAKPHDPDRPDTVPAPPTLQPVARVALSIALSLAIAALGMFALSYLPPGLTAVSVATTLALATTGLVGVAWWRRMRLPPGRRMRFELRSATWEGKGRGARLRAALLGLAILFALGASLYAVLTPREPDPFTESYLLGTSGTPGCYPKTFEDGAYRTSPPEECDGPAGLVTLGLVNHEGRSLTYTVRAVWTNETIRSDNTTDVNAAVEWQRWDVELEHRAVPRDPGSPHQPQYEVPLELPPPPGPGLWRLSFQVYLDTPPAVEPTPGFLESPHRRVHLWIDNATAVA